MFVIRRLIQNQSFLRTRLHLQTLRSFETLSFEDIPDVSPTKIKQFLKINNVSYEEGYTSYITACLLCSSKSKASLYINKTTGLFICPSCKSSGQWNVLENYLKRKITKSKNNGNNKESMISSERDTINQCLERINGSTIDLKTLPNEIDEVFTTFKLPKVNDKILDIVKIRIDNEKKNLYFPLDNIDFETVGYKVLNAASDYLKVEPNQNCTGIHVGKVRSRETAVVVPNLSDFLILLNSKVTMNVICLPNGLSNLSQYILPSFERYNKLILWFGNDFESWDQARNFAKKLGEKRCLFIRPIDKHPLPHLQPDQDFKSIISSAQPIWHKSITTFTTLREDVLSDLQNIDKVEGVKWKRFPALNKILKGHRKGELTVITGPTGSGKTTFISEYSLDLAMQGVNTLWGSFEIRNARLARTMLQQYSGIPLEENMGQFDFWADKFERLPIYFMTFHGQQTLKIVMEAVEHATYVHDITHVIIDNLQFMMGMSDDARHLDRFWKQDLIVAAFRNFATRKNCHVSLVIHPRKERDAEDLTASSIFGGAKASQEADNVLIIQDKRLQSLRGKKYLQVVKNRYSGDLGVMTLDFDKDGLSFMQKKKKAVEKATGDSIDDK